MTQSTETMNETDVERRISALRKLIDVHMAVGAGDEVNKLRDEIGACYRLLENINKPERQAREERG